ncbi:MAG: hypothetical protein JWQ03_624 [Variovorax sp.]|nr:hypothetical protein [Variovorax sp.]
MDEISPAAVLGFLLVAGVALDVILRPLPILAPKLVRQRRHLFWAGLVALYSAILLLA